MPVAEPLSSHPRSDPLLSGTWAMLGLLLAFDASGLDLPLAQVFGSANGFPLKDAWWLEALFHRGGRAVIWGVVAWVVLGVWWPVGALRRLDVAARTRLAATTLLALAAVSALKSFSTTSCPWDLSAFGGGARLVSHWHWGAVHRDGGSGRCFPAGHASGGFAFVAGFFSFRTVAPVIARRWLGISIGSGLALGLAQQARGAHFMSHTLWSGATCWAVALAVDAVWPRRSGAAAA